MKDITKYIPQRPPFVMVDEIIHCDEIITRTKFSVREDCIFIHNNKLLEVGLVENIAQTCAARMGFLKKEGEVKIGMIGSIDNFFFYKSPSINDSIITEIEVTNEILNIVVLSAKTYCNDIAIAGCDMKLVLTDISSTN